MASNRILERLTEIEQKVAASGSVLRAVREGSKITFETGPGCATGTAIGCAVLCIGFAGFASVQALSFPSPASWFLLVCIWGCAYSIWKSGSSQGVYEQQVFFELDTEREEIIRYDTTISIDEIEHFLGSTERITVEDDHNHLYAVMKSGEKVDLTGLLMNASFAILRNLQVLGYICEKPAFYQDAKGKLAPVEYQHSEF